MKAKTEEVERALWEMVRGFEERALLLKRLAKKEQDRGNGRSTTEFEKQAEKALENARTLKEMMVLEAV
jgi:hypothetical protein